MKRRGELLNKLECTKASRRCLSSDEVLFHDIQFRGVEPLVAMTQLGGDANPKKNFGKKARLWYPPDYH